MIRFFRILKLKELLESQIGFIQRLGYDVAIDGKKGAGKTTLVTGVCQLVPFMFQSMIYSLQDEISSIIPEFPFERLKLRFQDLRVKYDFNTSMNLLRNEYTVIDDLGEIAFKYGLDEIYFDGSTKKYKYSMVEEFFYAFNEMLRPSHIYSNIEMFIHAEGYTTELKRSWFDIKNNNDYPIPDYAFMVVDENSLRDGNDNAISRLNADTGSSDRMRLQRNAAKGTNFTWYTQQNADRTFASERELFDSIVHVERSYMVAVPKFRLNFLNFKRKLNDLLYRLSIKLFHKHDLDYLDSMNKFKIRKRNYEIKEKKLINKSWLCFDCTIYDSINDIKITNERKLFESGAFQYQFYFPIWYCYGNVDSYCFRPVFEYLRNRSNLKPDDLNRIEIDTEWIEDILMKNKDRLSKKKVSSSPPPPEEVDYV